MKNNHVGIVVVSYNAPQAVAMTLDSLATVPTDSCFSVVLVENSSAPEARAAITQSMKQHIEAGHFSGRIFQLEVNKGFSGGNNVGIAYFLSQPDITHICLLNSDVVVSDHWLDYLLEGEHDAVGPLTNASNNEQGIPVPYRISRDNGELLFDQKEYLDFAAQRHETWKSSVCPSKFISFFCTLFSRNLVQKVGYLDTRFHPGAYEDDDYCVRILENGFKMHIRRDVFVHHWGSASFSKLKISDRQHHGLRNRARFIAKHHSPWLDRTHLAWRAWIDDALFAFEHPDRIEACRPMLRLYEREIIKLAQALDSRYNALGKATGICTNRPSEEYICLCTEGFAAKANNYLSVHPQKVELQQLLQCGIELETAVSQLAISCTNMENFAAVQNNITSTCLPSLTQGADGVEELWNVLQSIRQGIIFFAGYPYSERLKDGYFQRVAAIDRLFPASHYRIYCDVSETFSDQAIIQVISDNTILLRMHPYNASHQLLVSNVVLRCKKVYYHSILRTAYPMQRMWLYEEGVKKILDVHGVVPEEFIYCGDDYVSAALYSEYEALALRLCDTVVVVSEEMRKHLEEKYATEYGSKAITLPILPNITFTKPSPFEKEERIKIVYAGGSHPWQCVPKMLEAITTIIDTIQVDIFATVLEDFLALVPQILLEHPNFMLTSTTHNELCAQYPSYHYGFLLRDDVVVNRAACPTKLVEYLASCIVPILDSEKIGDFAALGMKYLHVNDLISGRLLSPEEYVAYTKHNLIVLELLQKNALTETSRLKKQILAQASL